jgi:hypothetical protein
MTPILDKPLSSADFTPGETVKVRSGTLVGMSGVVVKATRDLRLIVSIQLPGRELAVLIGAAHLEKLIEKPISMFVRQQPEEFISRWSFWASLLLDSHQAEDHINYWEEVYERDSISDGQTKARILYVRDVLVSLWPVAKWVFHRAVVAGILKHYFPAVETITRLFRF